MNWQPFVRVVFEGIHPFGQGAFGHNPWWFKENNYHGGLKIITTKPTPKPTLATWPIIHFLPRSKPTQTKLDLGQPKLDPNQPNLNGYRPNPS